MNNISISVKGIQCYMIDSDMLMTRFRMSYKLSISSLLNL